MPADEARSVIASALRKTLSDHGTALLQDLGLGFGHEQSQAEREVMEFQRQVLDRLTATSTPDGGGPIAMNIVIHEAQHAVQTEIHRDYEALSPQERQDMKDGRIPDTFAEHGSSIEEAERLAEADPHYNPKSSRYGEAPKEIDARQAVYEWSDDLTEEKMKEYVDRVRE